MDDSAFEATLSIDQVPRMLALAAWGVFGGACATLYGLTIFGAAAPVVWALVAISMIPSAALVWLSQRPRGRLARIRADASGLYADGEKIFARARVKSGYLQPHVGRAPAVRLMGEGWLERADIEVEDGAQGAKLLAALGLDPSRSIARFTVLHGLPPNQKGWIVAALFFVGFLLRKSAFLPHSLPFLALAAFVAIGILDFIPSRVSVGADGILVSSSLRRKFLPFSKIGAVESSPWGAVLLMKSGKRIDLRTHPRKLAPAHCAGRARTRARDAPGRAGSRRRFFGSVAGGAWSAASRIG